MGATRVLQGATLQVGCVRDWVRWPIFAEKVRKSVEKLGSLWVRFFEVHLRICQTLTSKVTRKVGFVMQKILFSDQALLLRVLPPRTRGAQRRLMLIRRRQPRMAEEDLPQALWAISWSA